jgi:hypothetical protein
MPIFLFRPGIKRAATFSISLFDDSVPLSWKKVLGGSETYGDALLDLGSSTRMFDPCVLSLILMSGNLCIFRLRDPDRVLLLLNPKSVPEASLIA